VTPPQHCKPNASLCNPDPPLSANSDLRLTRADQMDSGVVTVHGSDDDGWIRLTINAGALADAGQTQFNQIVFKDVSGAGSLC
jgi:hypothetical protein